MIWMPWKFYHKEKSHYFDSEKSKAEKQTISFFAEWGFDTR